MKPKPGNQQKEPELKVSLNLKQAHTPQHLTAQRQLKYAVSVKRRFPEKLETWPSVMHVGYGHTILVLKLQVSKQPSWPTGFAPHA